MKRTKATREQLDKTSRSRGKKEEMYNKMANAAIQALVNREMDILLTFPFFVKIQKGFPKGILIEKTLTTNTYKVKTKKLLDWLYEKGYSNYNSDSVMEATRQFNFNITRMINELEGDI
jgi:hypothetical protein